MRLIRLRQTLLVLVGLAVAAVMVVLGLWQLDVYRAQGEEVANRRAALPPVEVSSAARAGQPVSDGYGRPVIVSGRYLTEAQALVPVDGRAGAYRVLTALRLANGDVLPVVRGLTTADTVPPAPAGQQTGTGLLLPSEEAPTGDLPAGQISSVRLPTLAQSWPGPLVSGFVTLSDADAAAQGLEPAPVALPEASGRLRNGAYALQWWVFAGFAIILAVRMARDQVLRGPEVAERAPEEQAHTT